MNKNPAFFLLQASHSKRVLNQSGFSTDPWGVKKGYCKELRELAHAQAYVWTETVQQLYNSKESLWPIYVQARCHEIFPFLAFVIKRIRRVS